MTTAGGIKNPKFLILSSASREAIQEQMKSFNGDKYPVVLKTLTGEHGKGVMILESFNSLFILN